MSHETARLLMIAAELLGVLSAGALLFPAVREGRLRVLLDNLQPQPLAENYPAVERLRAKWITRVRESLATLSPFDFGCIVVGLSLGGISSLIKLCVVWFE